MKKLTLRISCLILHFLILNSLHSFSTKKTIAEGITYTHLQTQTPLKLSLHMVEIDPSKVSLELVEAENKCIGRQRVSEMATENSALAAINGGYSSSQGIPAGMLKINDLWFANEKCARAALGWTHNGKRTLIDIISTSWTITIGNLSYPIHRLNQPHNPKQAILYTPVFDSAVSVDKQDCAIVVSNNTVVDVSKGNESITIPYNGFVYVIGHESTIDHRLIQIGMSVKLSVAVTNLEGNNQNTWKDMDFIIGGTPLLIKDGKKITDFASEKILQTFIESCYPRTAVGILPNGHWVWVVIDARNGSHGKGVTLHELADLMESLGCTDALNLCGGKSSTLYLQGKVVTKSFSFQLQDLLDMSIFFGEKTVSDAIIAKKRPSRHLS